jgi:hypothetical protein
MISFFSERISTDTKFDSLIRVSWLILFAIANWPYDIEILSARAYLAQPISFAVASKEAGRARKLQHKEARQHLSCRE